MVKQITDLNRSLNFVPTPQSPAYAGMLQYYAGATAPAGWMICDGTVLSQSAFADLYENLGDTWDAFAHPVDGTPTVAAGQFALPNLKGLYLGGVGNGGGDVRSLGVFQQQATAKNGLSNAASAISGTANATNPTFPFDYNHRVNNTVGGGTNDIKLLYPNGQGLNLTSGSHTHSLTGTAAAQALTGDNETRPATAPMTIIIKLYNDVGDVSMSLSAATATERGAVALSESFAATASQFGFIKRDSNFQASDSDFGFVRKGTITLVGRSTSGGGATNTYTLLTGTELTIPEDGRYWTSFHIQQASGPSGQAAVFVDGVQNGILSVSSAALLGSTGLSNVPLDLTAGQVVDLRAGRSGGSGSAVWRHPSTLTLAKILN